MTNQLAQPRRPILRRRWIFIVGAVLLLGGGAAALLLRGRGRTPEPPPLDADPVLLAKFAATPQFAKLSDERKMDYLRSMMQSFPKLIEASRSGVITPEEAQHAMENVSMPWMRQRVGKYYELPPGPARLAYMDQLINEQELQMKLLRLLQPSTRPSIIGFGRSSGTTSTPPASPGGPPKDSGMMKRMIENCPPHLRSELPEFLLAMRQRREQRGLSPDPYRR